MSSAKFASILRLLAENEVEAVVVGMLAGVLQGAPLTTGDIDIVHRRTAENVQRLLKDVRARALALVSLGKPGGIRGACGHEERRRVSLSARA
jgi:hypothetical protein